MLSFKLTNFTVSNYCIIKAPQIMEFKWGYLIMKLFWNFAFTNPGKVQNQIIPRISKN